jgi:prepilin-type processing-associated H-X9-DG protein
VQFGLAAANHIEAHGHFPTGGWGWGFVGDPDYGFGKRQPGGWHYSLLAFFELEDLREMGTGGNRAEGKSRVETPVSMFYCPSRRAAVAYPFTHGSSFVNIDRPRVIGRSDYAACGGDRATGVNPRFPSGHPETVEGGNETPDSSWETLPGTSNDVNGVIYRRSETRLADLADGATNIYLVGERYLAPNCYHHGGCCDNDQGAEIGYDYDVIRWTGAAPAQDRPGWGGCMTIFGSAHWNGFNMVFCDGSVHQVNYGIDPRVHQALGGLNNDKELRVIPDKSKF